MAATETEAQARQISQDIFARLRAGGGQEKVALDMVNNFTRTRMREDGFLRKIMPAIPITNDELDRSVSHEKPIKIVDREPNSPAAMSIPFGTMPNTIFVRGSKYVVHFDRIVSPRFTKDTDELRTYEMDIRQILSDNAIKDMLAEEDSKLILATNRAIGGSAGVETAWSEEIQWDTIAGGVTRENWQDALAIMPRTDASLEAKRILLNNITIRQFLKWGRNEIGGDLAEEFLRDGFTLKTLSGVELISTIKRRLVPDNTIFMYASEAFLGKHYTLEETVMYVKREAFMMEFFAYQTSGLAFGHTGGIARADFVN